MSSLAALEPLQLDDYIITFDSKGNQFYGTSKGYMSTYIPMEVLSDISTGHVKRISWASYGSKPDLWFFSYKTEHGAVPTYRIGKGAPEALLRFISELARLNLASIRVQFGNKSSFVAWSGTIWAASHDLAVRAGLKEMSSSCQETSGFTMGSLKHETLDNVQWHQDGSWYIKSNDRHIGKFQGAIMRRAWAGLWKGTAAKDLNSKLQGELAYIAMNPHVTSGDAFVIFKKQKPGKEATFILRLDDGRLHSNLPSSDVPSLALQTVDKATYQPSSYQWATSRKSGRPHKSDTWELELKQGEKVKVFKDMGRDWFLVEGKRGVKGCVHGSWLDFGARKVHANPKSAYDQFQMDLQEWLASGQLCSFLNMTSYIDSCTKPECQLLKEDVNSIGICVHDLLILLEGSGKYSREWLKEHRNMWHPDRFARFCHPQHAQRLTSLAGQMFVYYGILMEKT